MDWEQNYFEEDESDGADLEMLPSNATSYRFNDKFEYEIYDDKGVIIKTVPKTEFFKQTHKYQLVDIITTDADNKPIAIGRYPSNIVSMSKFYTHSTGKGGFYRRKSNEPEDDLYTLMHEMLIHYFNSLGNGLAPSDQQERLTIMQEIEPKLKFQPLNYLSTSKIIQFFETIVLSNECETTRNIDDDEIIIIQFISASLSEINSIRLSEYISTRVASYPSILERPNKEFLDYLTFFRAADEGSKLHRYIEYRLKGLSPDTIPLDERAGDQNIEAADLFIKEFFEPNDMDVFGIEIPLSSYMHKVAGQPDAVLTLPGLDSLMVWDWKVSAGLRTEIEKGLKNGKCVKGIINQSSPFYGMCDMDDDDNHFITVKEMTISSIFFTYGYQLGGYGKLLELNGMHVCEFVYLVLLHPTIGCDFWIVEIDLNININERGKKSKELQTIIQHLNSHFKNRTDQLQLFYSSTATSTTTATTPFVIPDSR